MKTNWKLERIDWHKHGLCWRWSRITKHVFYSGNQVQISWGRIAFVFERREWIHCENVKVWHGKENGGQSEAKEGHCPPLPLPSCSDSSSPDDNVVITSITEGPGWERVEYTTTDGKPPHPDSYAVRRGIVSVPSHHTYIVSSRPLDYLQQSQSEEKSILLDSSEQEESQGQQLA